MPPVIAAVGTAVGGFLLGAGASLAVASTLAVVSMAATVYGLARAAQALGPKPPKFDRQTAGLEVSYRGTTEPRRIIYGQSRLGGMDVTPRWSSGTNGEYLHFVQAVAGHECEAITDVWINQDQITSASIGAITGADTDGLVSTGTYANHLWIRRVVGTATDTADYIFTTAFASVLTSAFRGRGVAKVYTRLKYSTDIWKDGVPEITYLIKGRKCYDPRTATTIWTQNPAVCLRDFLVTYVGVASGNIDDTSFIAAANVCDALVDIPPAATQQARYTCNGVFFQNQDPKEIIQQLCEAMMGRCVLRGDKWYAYAGAWDSPSETIEAYDWIAGQEMQIEATPERADRYNFVRCWYVDPARNYQRVECLPQQNATYETQDGGERIPIEIEQVFCNSEYEAQRKAKLYLRQSRNGVKISGRLGPRHSGLPIWDTVTVNLSEFSMSSKTFRIVAMDDVTDGGMSVVLREEQSSDWNSILRADYDTAFTSPGDPTEAVNVTPSAGASTPTTSAETTAGVTPVNYGYLPGDPRRYGAVLDGTTDDTTALQTWASVGGALIWPEALTGKITAAIPLVSGTNIDAVRGATIQTATTNISFFTASSKSNIRITGLKFVQTAAGATAYTAAVKLTSCSDVSVIDCEMVGMQWAGIMWDTCTRCEARNNYMHDWLGTVQDSSGVCLYQTTTYCTVEGNKLYATGNEGVLHQDPYTSSLPQHNNIIDNKIKDQIGYGIAVYQPAGGNVYCLIRGNDIQNISGTIPTNPDSGNGVYIAGCGGVSVIGNTIRNCCISTNTATRSLAPAAIGINGVAAGMIQPIVSDNLISEMPTLDGILITSSPGGGIICDNTILQAVGNTGGTPIRVEASSNVQISGNSVNNLSTGVCVYLYANGVSMTNISVSGGALLGGNTAQIRCSRNGAFTISNLTISGVVMRSIGTTGTGSIVFDTSVVTSALVVGNGIEANTVPALYLSAATNVRVAANVLSSTGTNAVTTTGTCTGGSLDRSNKLTGLVNNGGTAFVVEQYATAAPGTGTAAVGDRRVNSSPTVGGTEVWVCTTAGTPGTWTALTGAGGVSDGDKGDITVSGSGATFTIDANVVSLAKMAQISTANFLGRTTAGTGNVESLTSAQATALLDTFTATLKGLAPTPGSGNNKNWKYLTADGTYQIGNRDFFRQDSDYTLTINDRCGLVRIGNVSTTRSLVIPTNASVAFPWNGNSAADADANGTWVLVMHYSSSSQVLRIEPASGVTIRYNDTGSTSGTITFGSWYSHAADTRIKLTLLVKAATDTWYLYPLIT